MYLVERRICVRDFCGSLCLHGVRIGRKLSCCGGSDQEDFLPLVGVRESGPPIFSLGAFHYA